jgi:hypothetical protein
MGSSPLPAAGNANHENIRVSFPRRRESRIDFCFCRNDEQKENLNLGRLQVDLFSKFICLQSEGGFSWFKNTKEGFECQAKNVRNLIYYLVVKWG